jgi:pSer/pThr/pTyr-binding forkhead associated (FHA) protein
VNDVVIDDPKVSRCHAVITLEAGFPVVRNLSSKNGLRVNGRPVHARLLRDGDGLTLGDCELQFIADEATQVHSQDPESTLLPA